MISNLKREVLIMSTSSKEWKAKMHQQHQDEDKLSSNNKVNDRYDNKDTEVKGKRFGTHRAKRVRY